VSETYAKLAGVRRRYGGVSPTWIARRLADPILPFPKPVRFGPRGPGLRDKRERLWVVAELDAYDAAVKAVQS
jgi:hypothetical protein